MTAPTVAQSEAILKAHVLVLDEFEKAMSSNTPNINTLSNTAAALNIYENTAQIAAGLRRLRGIAAGPISPAEVRLFLTGSLAAMAQAIGASEGLRANAQTAMLRLREYWVTNSKSLNAREFTRGAATAGGSNVGNGTINRLNVDEDGFALEGSHAEVKTFTCRQDQSSRREKHIELFEIEGAVPEQDLLKVSGSGIGGAMSGLTTRNTDRYLANPTFSQFSGTAPTAGSEATPSATTSVTNWVLTTAANARVSLDVVYRDFVSTGQKYSLRFTGNNLLVQTLASTKNPTFAERRPYYVQVAIYREANCDGTLTLRFGASSVAVAMSTLTNAAWNIVRLTLDKRLYHKNFKEDNMTVELELGSRTTGTLYADDWVIEEMSLLDGGYVALVGGATPFMAKDVFTITDTVSATRGKLSYWLHHRSGLWRNLDGFCLPVNAAAGETVTDPS